MWLIKLVKINIKKKRKKIPYFKKIEIMIFKKEKEKKEMSGSYLLCY